MCFSVGDALAGIASGADDERPKNDVGAGVGIGLMLFAGASKLAETLGDGSVDVEIGAGTEGACLGNGPEFPQPLTNKATPRPTAAVTTRRGTSGHFTGR
jgi:hypothetical protein